MSSGWKPKFWPEQIHQDIAKELHRAVRSARPVEHISSRYPQLTVDDAYAIQREIRQLELVDGAQIVGHKIGATSEAIQQMFNIDQPDSGFITNRMTLPSGATLDSSRLISPMVEGEIAFVLGADLSEPSTSAQDVLDAASAVVPVLEILDTRFASWELTIVDTIADNASCALVVVGSPVDHHGIDLSREEMTLTVDGASYTATGSAVLGHPAEAVAQLVRILVKQGRGLSSGDVVLAGSWSIAVPITSYSEVHASFTRLGEVQFSTA